MPAKSTTSASAASERQTMTTCTTECGRVAPSWAHCAACHRTFGGVRGFDDHRRDGQCIDPSTLGMVEGDAGVWRVPLSEAAAARLTALSAGRHQ